MSKQLTISELYLILGELIADGYGNREFQLWYDSETAFTSIPKGSSITLINKAVRFTDYNDGKCHYDKTLIDILENMVMNDIDDKYAWGTSENGVLYLLNNLTGRDDYNINDVVVLLNSLERENRRIKRRNQLSVSQNRTLHEENQELKQQLSELKDNHESDRPNKKGFLGNGRFA